VLEVPLVDDALGFVHAKVGFDLLKGPPILQDLSLLLHVEALGGGNLQVHGEVSGFPDEPPAEHHPLLSPSHVGCVKLLLLVLVGNVLQPVAKGHHRFATLAPVLQDMVELALFLGI